MRSSFLPLEWTREEAAEKAQEMRWMGGGGGGCECTYSLSLSIYLSLSLSHTLHVCRNKATMMGLRVENKVHVNLWNAVREWDSFRSSKECKFEAFRLSKAKAGR